jgi:hypothetical protein
MFQDILHFQNLFESHWPGVTITNDPLADGNQGAAWNYAASSSNVFTGKGTGTPYFDNHNVFGAYGVDDSAYTSDYTTGTMGDRIGMDPGTAASTAVHGASKTRGADTSVRGADTSRAGHTVNTAN